MKLGEKIKTLRKQRNISQEVLANYLGISFQSVSKWENESTMPDVMMIPAIASFFGISTDELFVSIFAITFKIPLYFVSSIEDIKIRASCMVSFSNLK